MEMRKNEHKFRNQGKFMEVGTWLRKCGKVSELGQFYGTAENFGMEIRKNFRICVSLSCHHTRAVYSRSELSKFVMCVRVCVKCHFQSKEIQ